MNCLKMIAKTLAEKKKTLAIAESCTGGMVSNTLSNISGCSTFFKAGFITYSNEAKTKFLKVPKDLLLEHGAASEPVARAMAEGARKAAKANFAISLTGIAGPTGGTPQKPVGLVFMACASSQRTTVERHIFKGTRLQIKKQATQAVLELLLKTVK